MNSDRRDKLAEQYASEFGPPGKRENIRLAYLAGFDGAMQSAEVRGLVEALKSWYAFEEECIKRDGPYVSLKIPEQMNRARMALKAFHGEGR